MEWKPYILFPNEAQEWQTAPLGLSYGCLQVEATGPSHAALKEPAGDAGPGQQTHELIHGPQQICGGEKKKNLKICRGGGNIQICYLSKISNTTI